MGQKVDYARVSSVDQNLDRQIELLRKETVFTYYEARVSGTARRRPRLEQALRHAREGDQLIVVSMDRLDLYSLVDEFTTRGSVGEVLKEGQTYLRDSTPVAQLMLGRLETVAEFERSIIR